MKIAIASDHAGFKYKEKIKEYLSEKGWDIRDFGTYTEASCSYPDFIIPAARAVSEGICDRGIVLGGSGNGEAIAANKISRIRCALCWNNRTARLSRRHNNANMLALGERMISIEAAYEIVDIWLNTEFEGGRHIKRIDAIEDLGS
ncbi:ribose 5-phosphate isomerase B [Sedimentisphaera salicampi]|uniref:ribose 5-phosphate isomerase B n=1 Tax=Sedimentisphaera salicampi TaxID=1941349 RepID=UPI000B9BF48C|nr:ribose 5-phosphate isomerase B [Sedimentisphaera salicampi]OXU14757.1 putative sugar phosphate isomerase YwlF [Sedimentisphaera salicampi]